MESNFGQSEQPHPYDVAEMEKSSEASNAALLKGGEKNVLNENLDKVNLWLGEGQDISKDKERVTGKFKGQIKIEISSTPEKDMIDKIAYYASLKKVNIDLDVNKGFLGLGSRAVLTFNMNGETEEDVRTVKEYIEHRIRQLD